MNATLSKRVDDKFMRNLIIALVSVIIAQGISYVYLVGTVSNQVSNNTADIKELKRMHSTLISIDTQVRTLSSNMIKISDTMTSIAYEQQRRTPIINRAEEYLNSKDSERR